MSGAGVKQMCVGEEDKQMRSSTTGKQWCDLPHHLLSRIANGLGLIDLISFRGVCKDWRAASSEASAQVESMHRKPWFLMYGEGPQCSLLTHENKSYTLNIQELDGATCVASSAGWLLLFKQGSMSFFCPFSRAKIDLPECPFSELPDLSAAAFSSAPTCQDCIVAVVMLGLKLELHLLSRGDNRWVEHDYRPSKNFGKLGLATYHEGAFHIFDSCNGLVTFVTDGKDIEWESYRIVPRSTVSNNGQLRIPESILSTRKPVSYIRSVSRFCSLLCSKEMDVKLGLELNASFSISICGTKIAHADSYKWDDMIYNEMIRAPEPQGCTSRNLKGVWIQPRHLQISPDQSW